MKRKFEPPTSEMMGKIRRAQEDTDGLKTRNLLCPYCRHRSIVVYEDARGHIKAKCKVCGQETIFDLVNMRRPRPLHFRV